MKRETTRGGFTLIELLIVTVVIATLMGIVFRLAGVGGGNRAKAVTISRMQRIENALSGYYAAYGAYPPVPLQGRSRSIYKDVDECGLQETGNGESGEKGKLDWNKMRRQVIAACKSQPIAVLYPFNYDRDNETVQTLSSLCNQSGASSRTFTVTPRNVGGFELDKSDWRECSLFQFGLLSFLLPRYFFMLEGSEEFYDHVNSTTGRRCGQWAANNQLPCRLDTGDQFESWEQIQKFTRAGRHYNGGSNMEASMISNLTSQAVCARWMPNFEGIISGGKTFFGVDTHDGDRPFLHTYAGQDSGNDLHYRNRYGAPAALHTPKGYSRGGGGGTLYLLNGMTIVDGWGQEFFYYSEAPFGSYKLWSSGANLRTFPPWYDRSKLSSEDLKTVAQWTEDDISGLNN